ncbi:MAG: J domain-containing protein [Limnospira sp. PMC 1291.21]|uniref:Chaperone DnaJ domain protein n=3 Tax=Limnospira TaxID=2596745 RepID=B5W5D8_LIMMA|nr:MULTISPECIES: J domain-containing protein [Limnospira]EKD09649.1 chaperone DnaJ domain protein [Arthrospira platensis C1]MDC0837112.1 J domain-containing protein [Limnoraphis robusta]MDY7054132.1 J domain-containing protein [Limnospira fusiformis LS22]QJB28977.1 J domain-containing protein [Limnospira fusiformis SAG 85.79]RAQ45846.1 J domain-containing protein [Arthrospira sp. O9.13F]
MSSKMNYKDYYGILGVDKNASQQEIKKVYRNLARKYHPDVNPNDRAAEQRFKDINEAYEVLGDRDKRQKYDQFGKYWDPSSAGPPPGGVGDFDFNQYGNFDDFINELLGRFGGNPRQPYGYPNGSGYSAFDEFGDFFGGGNRGYEQVPPRDFTATLPLTFSEAFKGVEKKFNLDGETIKVKIPPGAKPDSRIRLKGKGGVSPTSGKRGDLYLTVELEPHPFFQFDGNDLICEVGITPEEAVLGAEIQVPTPSGKVTMKVPPGVASGQSLRLRGKGWPIPKGGQGDQIVRLKVVAPKTLSDRQRQLYQELQQISSFNPRQNLENWLN